MRTALHEPLHNISDDILNRVISKSIQADLRKFKMGKSLNRTQNAMGTTALRDRTRSPVSKRAAAEDYGADAGYDYQNYGDLSNEVSGLLSQLNQASGNKMSLIKMQVIKCDESSNNFKRMRHSLNVNSLGRLQDYS
jgi:hypothetical protein